MLKLVDKAVIRKACFEDIETVVRNIRDDDYRELTEGSGMSCLEVVSQSYDTSEAVWAGEYEGELVALFGVAPECILTGKGIPWMMSTDAIMNCQKTFLRRSRDVVYRMNTLYPYLSNYVDTRNNVAIAWLKWLGFKVQEKTTPYGPDRIPFHFFERTQ